MPSFLAMISLITSSYWRIVEATANLLLRPTRNSHLGRRAVASSRPQETEALKPLPRPPICCRQPEPSTAASDRFQKTKALKPLPRSPLCCRQLEPSTAASNQLQQTKASKFLLWRPNSSSYLGMSIVTEASKLLERSLTKRWPQ
jgi:hypothetical protein